MTSMKEVFVDKKAPGTSFTVQQLFEAARKAGEEMFGSSHTGLVFADKPEDVTVEPIRLTQLEEEGAEDTGDEAYIDTYEYVFFPSTGKGLDVADEPWADAERSWQDADGKIYTAWSEGIIRVVTVDRPLRR